MALWVIRILFLSLCTVGGYAVSQVRPEFVTLAHSGVLGTVIALLIDHSGLFENVEQMPTRWLIRLSLFLSFSYIGIVLAMRSNKEDFSLIIPYVRFAPRNKPDHLLLLDTSVIIDGRIADLIDANLIEGLVVVPRFVLKELQVIGDSSDAVRRARGRRGLDMLNRIQRNKQVE